MEPWNGMNFQCEQRMWGDEIACICLCAGAEMKSMDDFAQAAMQLNPAYDAEKGLLTARNYSLTWQLGQDDTQYL